MIKKYQLTCAVCNGTINTESLSYFMDVKTKRVLCKDCKDKARERWVKYFDTIWKERYAGKLAGA